jgi:diguanylate cyclase (GGDEF)-like protein/PAS domain S-box-containing protein
MPAFQDPDIYRDILDGLQIGVSVVDLQRRIIFWSDGAEQITGYTRIEVLGHLCTDNILLHCNQDSCETCVEKCPIATALHNARPMEAVSFIHHKLGHRTPVHAWAIPLRNQHGSIIGVIQTFEDEVAVNGPDPNDQSMKQGGWLNDVTGLPNQPMMQSHLRETLGSFAELQIPCAVVCVEIHDINQLRARYGHDAEISIVQILARTLRNTVWPTDFVGHWTESQFLVILCGCGEDALQAVTSRMRRMMSNATIVWWGEQRTFKVSLGGASAITGDSLESLMQRAQQSLSGNQSRAHTALSASATATPES